MTPLFNYSMTQPALDSKKSGPYVPMTPLFNYSMTQLALDSKIYGQLFNDSTNS